METFVRQSVVLEVRPHELTIVVQDPERDASLNVHWTSYWSAYPHQPIHVGDPVELIYNEHPERFLALRHPKK